METVKQHKLIQEREALLEKNEQLKAELQVLIDKSYYDDDHYTFSDDERGDQISSEITINARKIEAIDRKLEMYDVVCDCLESYNHPAQDVFFREGSPKGEIKSKRILAECYWNDEGFEPYFDILQWYHCEGLKYPEGWYDQGGENVPNNVIKRYAEF